MEAIESIVNKESMSDYEEEVKEVQVQDENNARSLCKKRRFQSSAWNYFDILPMSEDKIERCKCKKCGQIYVSPSKYGTGNMHKHVKKCIGRDTSGKDTSVIDTRDVVPLLTSTSNSVSTPLSTSKFDHEKLRELLAAAVIMHDLPFQFVEWVGIRGVLRYLREDVHVSENTCKAECQKLYTREKAKVQEMLHLAPGKVNLTIDCWSSLTTDGYIRLTAHFIDEDWHLKKRILNFCYMSPPHDNASLARKISSLLIEWEVAKKIGSVTLDDASVNNVCVDTLKSKLELKGTSWREEALFHVYCCAHVISLIVQVALNEVDNAVEKVRGSIKYVTTSEDIKEKFLKFVGKCSIESENELSQDDPAKWNSTYTMLGSALCYKNAFMDLMSTDHNYKDFPSTREWEKIERVFKFLSPFYEITCALSSTKYPTANLYFPYMFVAYLTLKSECHSLDEYYSKMATDMFVKFEKYWKKTSVIMAIAVCLDPRYKIQFVEWCYKKLYGEAGIVKTMLVKDELHKLFDEYRGSNKMAYNPLWSLSKESGGRSHDLLASNSVSHNIWREFDSFESLDALSQKSQLDLYLEEPKIDRKVDLDVLAYWKVNEYRYPEVASMARDVLSIPMSTVALESAFSMGGQVLDQFRSSLKPETVEVLICTRDWLYGEQELSKIRFEELVDDVAGVTINKDELSSHWSSVT